MPRRTLATEIGGRRYRMLQLGGLSVAELGEQMTEAQTLTAIGRPALAKALGDARRIFASCTEVELVDEGQNRNWTKLEFVFDDWFGGAPEDQGKWFDWALQASGVGDFLAGVLARTFSPKAASASGSPRDATGSSIVSSSANGTASAAAPRSSVTGVPPTSSPPTS